MGRGLLVVVFGGVSVSAFTACALISGLGDLAVCSNADCPEPADGGADAMADVTSDGGPQSCTAAPGPCIGALAAGWTPLAFAPSRTNGCPPNFVASDLLSSPSAQPGVCACACNLVTQPTCGVGVVSISYGNGACGNGPLTFNVTVDGQCVDYGVGSFNETVFQKWSKSVLTAGTCNGSAIVDPSKVTTTAVRACAPPAACDEDVCNGVVPAGFKSCIARDGNASCPPGPFTQQFVTGTSTSAQCSACSACTTSAQCQAATARAYGDSACTVLKDSVVADGNCNATVSAGGVSHFKYQAPVQNVTCTPGTSTPTVDLVATRTICCR